MKNASFVAWNNSDDSPTKLDMVSVMLRYGQYLYLWNSLDEIWLNYFLAGENSLTIACIFAFMFLWMKFLISQNVTAVISNLYCAKIIVIFHYLQTCTWLLQKRACCLKDSSTPESIKTSLLNWRQHDIPQRLFWHLPWPTFTATVHLPYFIIFHVIRREMTNTWPEHTTYLTFTSFLTRLSRSYDLRLLLNRQV